MFPIQFKPKEKGDKRRVTKLTGNRIGHAVSSRKRVEILEKAKALGVKVTNPKGRVTTEA